MVSAAWREAGGVRQRQMFPDDSRCCLTLLGLLLIVITARDDESPEMFLACRCRAWAMEAGCAPPRVIEGSGYCQREEFGCHVENFMPIWGWFGKWCWIYRRRMSAALKAFQPIICNHFSPCFIVLITTCVCSVQISARQALLQCCSFPPGEGPHR